MQHPDEGTIHAWLDGALTPAEASEIEAHTAGCAECRNAVAEARGLIAASSRIVSALDIVPAGVIPVRTKAKRAWYASTQLRAAAAVLFVAGASMVLLNRQGDKSLSELSERVMSAPAAEVVAPEPSPKAEQDAVTDPAPATQQQAVEEMAGKRGGTAKRGVAAAPQSPAIQDGRARAGAATGAANTAADVAPSTVAAPVPMTASAPAATAPPPPPADTATFAAKRMAVSPVVVTGTLGGVQEVADDLRILAIDSSSADRRITRYRIATGAELTLTETATVARRALSPERRFDDARAPSAPMPTPMSALPPPAVAQSTARTEAAAQLPLETLTWTDAQSRKTYTLSGRVPRETLEQVKARLQRRAR